MSGNVVVAIRVRPLASRELQTSSESVVHVVNSQTILKSPGLPARNGRRSRAEAPKVFNFDYSYDSSTSTGPDYADQAKLYADLGVDLLSKAFLGYNCCIFAYGQTGSGKSYTMMGQHNDQGLIPRICENLFTRINEEKDRRITYSVEVSYLEIYSEKVRDLLNPRNKANLRVREHPITGPYVADLSKLTASNFSDIERLMEEGNKTRTVASTNMNESSSRSHAVFSIILTQRITLHDIPTEKVSKISLVDLAGSERAESTGATGLRLKEGSEINRSLSTLGRVISALVARQTASKARSVVPYRDSVLTWLLKDSLGGNSLTAMIATISPSVSQYDETLSTLRYAQSAKHIKNHAIVNEDVNTKLIRELQEELASLRLQLGSPEDHTKQSLSEQMVSIINADGTEQLISRADIADRIAQSDRLVHEMNMSWEEKLQNTLRIQKEREAQLSEYGIEIAADLIGLSTPKKLPHLVNLSDDPLLTELLVYNLKPGNTICGNPEGSSNLVHCDIKLFGAEIRSQHCIFCNSTDSVTIEPCENAYVSIDGIICDSVTTLHSGCRIALTPAGSYLFRFQNPQEPRRRAMYASATTTPTRMQSTLRLQDGTSLYTSQENKSAVHQQEVSDRIAEKQSDVESRTQDLISLPFPRDSDSSARRADTEQLARLLATQGSVEVTEVLDQLAKGTSIDNSSSRPSTNETALSRKRMSDSEQLIQMLNAAAIEDEARGRRKSSNPLERLAAARYEAELQLGPTAVVPRFSMESFGTSDDQSKTNSKIAYNRWKQLRDVAMTKSMLKNAYLLQNARKISQYWSRNVHFQYTVVSCLIDPISPHEEDRVFDSLESSIDMADGNANLVVRVMDHDKNVLYFFSLEHLRRQIDKHEPFRQNKAFPFLDKLAPIYSLVGQATIVLPQDNYEHSSIQTVDIYNPYTNVQCAILEFSIICKEFEGKLTVHLKGLSILGLSERDISNVHMHAFFGNDTEKRLATQLVNGFNSGPVNFERTHVCQLSVLDLPDVLHFHVYGTISERYMLALHSWDDLQESSVKPLQSLSWPANLPVCTTFRISEMGIDGRYLPSEVLPASKQTADIFYLHQGLSRRLAINLVYPDQASFQKCEVESITVSDVRVPGSFERLKSDQLDTEQVRLKLIPGDSICGDGIRTVLAQWDSSMHNTQLLDRVTPPNKSVLITIQITLSTETRKTLTLKSDLSLRIYGRDENLSYLSRLFSAKTSLSVTKIFTVPQPPGLVADVQSSRNHALVAKNSSGVYCNTRTVSLINGFRRMLRHKRNSMAVQETRLNYDSKDFEVAQSQTPMRKERLDSLVKDIIRYWQLRTFANQTEPNLLERAMRSMAAEEAEQAPVIYATSVGQEKRHDGNLLFATAAEAVFAKAYFVISGPFLLRHSTMSSSSSTSSPVESVIDLRSAQIEVDGNDASTFSIFAHGSSLSCRAGSREDRKLWTDALFVASMEGESR